MSNFNTPPSWEEIIAHLASQTSARTGVLKLFAPLDGTCGNPRPPPHTQYQNQLGYSIQNAHPQLPVLTFSGLFYRFLNFGHFMASCSFLRSLCFFMLHFFLLIIADLENIDQFWFVAIVFRFCIMSYI